MKTLMKRLLPLSLAFLASLAQAQTATLSWTAPTTFTNGSAISGTITYNLYAGVQGSTLAKIQSAITTATTTVTGSTSLPAGTTVCFAVTAVVAGVESAQSAQACAAVPLPTPGVPTQITVVVH